MKILVLIKDVLDTRVALEYVAETGRIMDGWNVPILNPDDRAALSHALEIRKQIAGTHISVVHIGATSGERYIADSLALGCDKGVRIWDDGLENLHTAGKLLILARAAEILGFDLLFAGAKSTDTCSSQLGMLLASVLKVPCITRVSQIEQLGDRRVTVTRALEQGWGERVESPLPLVITVQAGEDVLPYAAFPDIARAAESTISCLSLADIGISRDAIRDAESRLAFGPLSPPAPGLKYIQPPDSSLPAFERRQQIGEGAIRKRQGRVVRGSEGEVAEKLFQALLQDGWLDHLRDSTLKASDDPDPL